MARIISGSAKGMKLASPKGSATRPTTDRVREALFSSLTTWFSAADRPADEQLAGVAVLDLFAGTGAVGLEAASRGAWPVTLVDHRTAAVMQENAYRAGLKVNIRASKVEPLLAAPGGPWDLVFIDPPYELPTPEIEQFLQALAAPGVLASQGLVVIERSKRSTAPVWPEGFTQCWERGYGESVLYFGATEPAGEEPQ